MTLDTASTSAPWIPQEPDLARMYSEVGAALRSAMADRGVDAMILLLNGHVTYATGASWPLLDAGLSHTQRPVAILVAGDEHPHLFMPFREGAAAESQVPADHRHGPLYLEFDEGVEHLAAMMAQLVPPGARVAVDEMTGAMRDAAHRLFPGGPPLEAAVVVGAAQLVKTPDQISCIRRACQITEQTMAQVQTELAPGARLTQSFHEILRDPAVNAVAIATPAESHAPLVRASLLAGKDVFVDHSQPAVCQRCSRCHIDQT